MVIVTEAEKKKGGNSYVEIFINSQSNQTSLESYCLPENSGAVGQIAIWRRIHAKA
jgi:hypothetical protein